MNTAWKKGVRAIWACRVISCVRDRSSTAGVSQNERDELSKLKISGQSHRAMFSKSAWQEPNARPLPVWHDNCFLPTESGVL
jgi:hypothetical protein